ncbi:MAG: tRNA (adenosine(37)-N6)-threonylcarbamoyltransferase complex transferase subunit TsaD [Candidatus Paceibacterota bacterium]
MKILGIETSCDDTCASVLEKRKKKIVFLSQIISSQEKLHADYGGVFPSLAKREHQKNIILVLEKSLIQANLLKLKKKDNLEKFDKLEKILERNPELLENLKIFLKKYKKPKIDKIAITIGPGLEPCLWVGVNLAKALSYCWDLPIIPINHLEGHLLSPWIFEKNKPDFPAIGLIVSGGNTQLILINNIGKYKLIGETRDDASGECFDKTARILGLAYPGGREIAKMASKFKKQKYNLRLPRPMIYEKNFDFSFSGLKTAVLYDYKKRSEKEKKSKEYIIEMSKEIQNSIIEVLITKTFNAAEKYKAKTIIVGGGVSANKALQKNIIKKCAEKKIACFFPKNEHTADNASMIALAAEISPCQKQCAWQKIKPNSNLKINGK